MTDVSIVICTRNRVASLGPTLASIATAVAATGAPTTELVVVDNGSSDGTEDLLAQWSKTVVFPVTLVREERPGLARARNVGIARATGRVLAMTDDDCRMAPDYLVLLKGLAATAGQLVVWGGRIELGDPSDLPLTIKTALEPATYRGEGHPGGFMHGCNMAMPRTTFDVVGTFDERLGAGTLCQAGEDTDYIYRAYLAGAEVRYVPSLLVHHFHGRKLASDVARLLRVYAVGNGALYLKHVAHRNLLRNLVWDVRGSLRELRGGPPLVAEFGFSYRKNVVFSIEGALRFAGATVRRWFAGTPSTTRQRSNV